MVKDLLDTLFENTLCVYLKVYEFEWYLFYSNVTTVVNFEESWEFSMQNACYRFRE